MENSTLVDRKGNCEMVILPKAAYRLVQSNEIPLAFSTETDQAILEFMWKYQSKPAKKSAEGGINMPEFKLRYRDVVLNTIWPRPKPDS